MRTTTYTLKPLSTGNGIVWRVLNAYGNEVGRRSTQREARELGEAAGMSAGTDAARAVVRGVSPKRPGLDLRPTHTLYKTLTEWSCTSGRRGVLLTERAREDMTRCPGEAPA